MTDSAGARLRAAILETYQLDAGEMVLVDQVVEVCDPRPGQRRSCRPQGSDCSRVDGPDGGASVTQGSKGLLVVAGADGGGAEVAAAGGNR